MSSPQKGFPVPRVPLVFMSPPRIITVPLFAMSSSPTSLRPGATDRICLLYLMSQPEDPQPIALLQTRRLGFQVVKSFPKVTQQVKGKGWI